MEKKKREFGTAEDGHDSEIELSGSQEEQREHDGILQIIWTAIASLLPGFSGNVHHLAPTRRYGNYLKAGNTVTQSSDILETKNEESSFTTSVVNTPQPLQGQGVKQNARTTASAGVSEENFNSLSGTSASTSKFYQKSVYKQSKNKGTNT